MSVTASVAHWVLLAALSAGWAGPSAASATAERSDVRLGEPFKVTVLVKHSPQERWELPKEQSFAPFVLRGQKQTERSEGGQSVTEIQLTLDLFELGPHALPELKLRATAHGESPHEFSLPGPVLKGVAPNLEKDRERRDIRGPVPLRITTLRPLLWALLALAGAGLLFLGWRLWKRRRSQVKAVPPPPPRPADAIALEALTQLEGRGLPNQGLFKEFHLILSEILRRYLTDRYRILALDMTSAELIEQLSRHPTEGLSLTDLAWLCRQGDLAKFAKGEPSLDDCKQALTLVRQLVLRTRARPEAAGAPLTTAPGGAT